MSSTMTHEMFFDRTGASIPLESWLAHRKDLDYRFIARTTVGEQEVITAWLGTDQGAGYPGEPALIFGTIVRHADGSFDDYRERFAATEAEAIEDHEALVQALNAER